MTRFRNFAVAAAFAAGLTAGAAEAAPLNAGSLALPAAEAGEFATSVHHWRHRHCWPVQRWVWTHWGWRYRTLGTRCAGPYGYQFYPRYY